MGQAPEKPKIPRMFFSTWSVLLTGRKSPKICFFSCLGASSIVGLCRLAFSGNGSTSTTPACLHNTQFEFSGNELFLRFPFSVLIHSSTHSMDVMC